MYPRSTMEWRFVFIPACSIDISPALDQHFNNGHATILATSQQQYNNQSEENAVFQTNNESHSRCNEQRRETIGTWFVDFCATRNQQLDHLQVASLAQKKKIRECQTR